MSSYSGASQAKEARENLGRALAALQADPNIPPDVLAVAQNIAQSVGALFEAEHASSDPDGKSCVKSALGSLSQTLALLQDVREEHPGIRTATETIASAMSLLFPLTTAPTRYPPAPEAPVEVAVPGPASRPRSLSRADQTVPDPTDREHVDREDVEANLGATPESNFFVGFSGEIGQGGVFIATYSILPKGSPVRCLITLPGNLSTQVNGRVRFVRDPMDMASDSEPGMGVAFEGLERDSRELILRFIRKRPPMFYDE